MMYDSKFTVNGVDYVIDQQERDSYSVFTIEEFPGLEAHIGYDELGSEMNPRTEWDNVGTMSVSYGRYNLGDEDISKIDFEIECPHCEGNGEVLAHSDDESEWVECPKCEGRYTVDINPVDYFKKECGARVVMGLTVYEHSGITMSWGDVTLPWDTDRWDTSFVGFIYDTPEGRKLIGDDATDEQITKALKQEVETYASYLEGDVSCWTVDDEETGFNESCGGYIGFKDSGVEQECMEYLKMAVEKRLFEIAEREAMAARDIMTA